MANQSILPKHTVWHTVDQRRPPGEFRSGGFETDIRRLTPDLTGVCARRREIEGICLHSAVEEVPFMGFTIRK